MTCLFPDVIRFSRGEYWILNEVLEDKFPLNYLGASKDELELQVGKKSHNLSHEGLLNTICNLSNSGLISFFKNGENIHIDSIEQIYFELFERKIKYGGVDEDSIACGLTKKGGIFWEIFTQPTWDLYIAVEEILLENDYTSFEISSINKNRLYQYIESLKYYEFNILQETYVEKNLSPWHATYWKDFDSAHMISFKAIPKTDANELLKLPTELPPYILREQWKGT
ncbi:MAG TPA: hypothetical protein PK018_07635 [Candidatus Competibacter sp.]|nr:hypothetical protein [Candidatus Competibacteraceae bacterium]HPE72024.1 hypothetical protein [Candidatus Competibacter sp.]HRW66673.1 hypothetical protein [Candidatus Competibacter sp.]